MQELLSHVEHGDNIAGKLRKASASLLSLKNTTVMRGAFENVSLM